MEIGKMLYAKNAKAWRMWLEKNHQKEKGIWLVFYNKASNKTGISYMEALDEAFCFGWIDSIVKKLDADSRVQRFTPRNPKSSMSVLNLEKVRRLIKENKMTPAGLIHAKNINDKFEIPKDVLKELKKDPEVWKNFQNFPESYKRVRITWVTDLTNSRSDEKKKRLNYFLKMTKANKKFGISI